MGKAVGSNVSAMAVGGTKIKVTVKSNGNGVYKYVDNSGDTNATIDLTTVKDSSGHTIAMGNAVDGQVVSGRTFSSNNGFNRAGTMEKAAAGNISATAAGGTKIKVAVKSGANGVYKYIDNSGDTSATIDLASLTSSGGGALSLGTATAGQVMSGATFTGSAGIGQTGTMPKLTSDAVTVAQSADTVSKDIKLSPKVAANTGNAYSYTDAAGVSGKSYSVKSFLNQSGTAKTNKVVASNVVSGKVFSSSDGIDQTGSMGKAVGNNISASLAGGTKIKVTVKSDASGTYKYIDNSGDTNATIDLTTVKDASGNLLAMGNAEDSKVLEGYTYSSNDGFNRTGTMVNRSNKKSGTPGISTEKQEYANIPVYNGTWLQYTIDTEGTRRISICPPEGYYPGNGKAYVGIQASDFGDASASDVLSGKTFTSASGLKVAGTLIVEDGTGSGEVAMNMTNGGGYQLWEDSGSTFTYSITQKTARNYWIEVRSDLSCSISATLDGQAVNYANFTVPKGTHTISVTITGAHKGQQKSGILYLKTNVSVPTLNSTTKS